MTHSNVLGEITFTLLSITLEALAKVFRTKLLEAFSENNLKSPASYSRIEVFCPVTMD